MFKSRATNWYIMSQNEWFPETILLTSQKKQKNLCPHIRTEMFAQWIILQDKKLPVQSQ